MGLSRLCAGLALLASVSCLRPVAEPDCLSDGACECRAKSECPAELDCVGGRCRRLPDAGLPGTFGAPCVHDADCTYGPCLPPGPGNGGVCTLPCASDAGYVCPRGWECKGASGGGAGLCAPPLRALCLRCERDSDCNALGDLCLTLATGERACGLECESSAQCPPGTSCRSVALDGGVVVGQCVPDVGTCECSALAAGLRRSCRRSTAVGSCFGFETCLRDGTWSGCDARLASREVCNGVDDDCDGLVDGADSDLDTASVPGYPDCRKGVACLGKLACGALDGDAGFAFLCSAPEPSPERCNGVDDDCNGVVDDGLVDDAGRYVSPRACGACGVDCFATLGELAADAGAMPGAAACVERSGVLVCEPRACRPGYYPSPPAAPVACARAVSSQCRPCTTSEDCLVPGDACLAFGSDPGLVCLQRCDEGAPYEGCSGRLGERGCCPEGSLCQDTGGAKLCQPIAGSCACTRDRVGLERACARISSAGVCLGIQRCTESGYGVCDTTATATEFCDGLDNDCDGVVDEGFADTRDSGTYDSDQACGSCAADCRVRWSAEVHHAVGGCAQGDAGAAPRCAVAQCTTAAIPAGAACRTDADCPAGRRCDERLWHCASPCAQDGGCPGGERCEQGHCGRPCRSAADCPAVAGAPPSVCTSSGVCALVFRYHDSNLDEADGCECPAPDGVADEPDVFLEAPRAGLRTVDRDCDGIDGDAARSLFVASGAAATGADGSRWRPFRSIADALRAFDPARHAAILVAGGTYVEQVVLRSGAKLYGGYDPDFSRRDVLAYPSLIEAPEPQLAASGARRGTVNAEGLALPSALVGFTVRGYDVVSRSGPGQPARNSYAVFAKDSPRLLVANNLVVAGRGGDAVAGGPGGSGASGGPGADGATARECATPDCAGEAQAGGAAGVNGACSGTSAGRAGAGATLAVDPQAYTDGGVDGRGGANGTYAHSDSSQRSFCKYDCTVPGVGLVGGPAQSGGDGSAGRGGLACADARGALSGDDWVSAGGRAGGDGTHGRGGGGGGAGGCVRNAIPATPPCSVGRRVGDLGGTGGGGGAGGCGGARGGGGGSGGHSFAIFVVGGVPTLAGNRIALGFGGAGGAGGAGGYGGLGGAGGRGGESSTAAWCAGQGGPGGRGGNGGAGGGGGGGCGGGAFGIAGPGVAALGLDARNVFAPVPVDAAGVGGAGARSPAGAGASGAQGAGGQVSLILSY